MTRCLLSLSSAVALALAASGCGAPTAEPPVPVAAHDDHATHDDHAHGGDAHPEHGPHGGDLVELGEEEYHAEVVHKAGTVTVYVLDGAAQVAVPINATELTINLTHDGKPEQFPLAASPEAGEAAGMSSRFMSDDAELAADLDGGAVARLTVTIDGTPFTGKISHDHGHDTHGHDTPGHGAHGHDDHAH